MDTSAARPRPAVRTSRRARSLRAAVVGVTGAVVLLGGAVVAVAPAPARADDGPAAAGAVVAAPVDPDGTRAYWTPERMRSATSLDGDGPAPGTRARVQAGAQARAQAGQAPRTVGKVFFTTPDGPAECSAATVNSASGSVVITAAHCIHSGAPRPCPTGTCPGSFYANFLFVPGYVDGAAPYGSWVGTYAVTTAQWVANEDYAFDVAMVRVAPQNGARLTDVVGGNGLAYDYPVRFAATVWGYPAEAPFNGQTAQGCSGATTGVRGSSDAALPCVLTGGASGGPWFVSNVDPDVGYIIAVTSRRTIEGPAYIEATPLRSDVVGLLAQIDGVVQRPVTSATALDAGSGPAFAALPTPARRAAGSGFRGLRARFDSRVVGRSQGVVAKVRTLKGRKVVLETRRKKSRGRWTRVAVARTDRSGVAYLGVQVLRPETRYFRVRTTGRATAPVKVLVRRCPVPFDTSRGVLRSLGCTDPSR